MSQQIAVTMPAIEDGAVAAYFIFDVAETIDLDEIAKMQSMATERVPLRLRPERTPSYIAFPVPPLSIALADLILFGKKANVRLKVYDYGVVSLRIQIPFSGSWVEFAELTSRVRQSPDVVATARKLYEDAKAQISATFRKTHSVELFEDYYVYTVNSFSKKVLGKELLGTYAKEVASLVRSEEVPLSQEEVEEATRVHLSYFEDDLSVVEWDVAFIYDDKEAADTIESILEFANTQLLELRTYDAMLNAELDWIYATDPVEKNSGLFGHSANQRAQRLRLMLVDIGELIDRTNNALKIIGDAFYARVYRDIRTRLGLSEWEKQIGNKLRSVSSIYGFLTDEAQFRRGEMLEWIVIALIFIEVVTGIFRH